MFFPNQINMSDVKKLVDILKYGLPCIVEVDGSLKQDGFASEEDEEIEDSIRNTLLRFEEELELKRISARVSEFLYPDEIVKLHGKDFIATRSLFVGSTIYLQYTYKGRVRQVNTKSQNTKIFASVKKKTCLDTSGYLTLAEIVDRCPLPQIVEFIDVVEQQDIVLTGDAERDYNFRLILSGPIELISVEKQKIYIGVTENVKTFILPHDKTLLDTIMGKCRNTAEHYNSRISKLKADKTLLDEKLFPEFGDSPRYLELGKAINAETVANPEYRVTAEAKSLIRKRNPPTFAPPLPPRTDTQGIKKSKAKQKEQNSPVKMWSKKNTKIGNLDAKKEYLTLPYYENVYSEPIFSDVRYLDDLTISKLETMNRTKHHSEIPDSNIARNYKMIDVAVEEVKREVDTKLKVCETLASVTEEADMKGNIYVPMTSLKKEMKTTNNINKVMLSGNKENGCGVKIDTVETFKNMSENEYVEMGYLETQRGSVNTISSVERRKSKAKSFKFLTKFELVERLEECGLNDLAVVCEKEKLDGKFLADHLSDQDLMHEPFSLSRYQIKKLKAAIGGWRPSSEFFSCANSD